MVVLRRILFGLVVPRRALRWGRLTEDPYDRWAAIFAYDRAISDWIRGGRRGKFPERSECRPYRGFL